jgi:dephospho-CoA kinase
LLPTLLSRPFLWAREATLRDEETQLARLLARPPVPPNPPLSHDDAVARMRAQKPLAEKVNYATAILRNNGTEAELRTAVAAQVATWRAHSKRWPTSWACWVCPPLGLLVGLIKLGRRWLAARAGTTRPGKGECSRF